MLIFLLLTSLAPAISFGAESCEQALLGGRFLHQRFPELYKSNDVQRFLQNSKEGPSLTQPDQKIIAWLSDLEYRSQNQTSFNANLKEWFFDNYVTPADEISESYFQLLIRIERERGNGNIQLSPHERKQLADIAVQDQKDSLGAWIDYLTSPDAFSYPVWAKYWALMGVVKMGKFDPGSASFQKRSRGSALPFPEINHEVFAHAIDLIVKKVERKNLSSFIQDPKLLKILEDPSFANLYARLWITTVSQKRDLTETQGEWVKYLKGSNPSDLVESLQGMNTGWCTAAFNTAEAQLKGGDFYVYYSFDSERKATVPRLAIRMEDARIAEVRGIAANQNLDSEIAGTSILQDKLQTFGEEGQKYLKRSHDMRLFTEIEKKHNDGKDLSSDELRFLYEIDSRISGFGFQSDPRIEEVRKQRDPKADLAKVFDCQYSEISTTTEEALRGGIRYHYGTLDLKQLESAEGLILPQAVRGHLYLSSLKSAEGLILPQAVGGTLSLIKLTSTKGLILPQNIGGDLQLNRLTSAENLTFPRAVGGSLSLIKLASTKGLILPQNIGGDLQLNRLTSAENLTFPRTVGGSLSFDELTYAKDLILPQNVGGSLRLNRLTSVENLTFPRTVGGSLLFDELTDASGLILPQNVGGSLRLNRLTSAENFTFPRTVGGDLSLNELTYAEDLILPQNVGGSLHLHSLTSAENLTFPQTVGGSLSLDELTSVEGLTLPQHVGGGLFLNHLTSAENLTFPQTVGWDLSLRELTSANGLILPQNVGGSLHLHSLTSAEGLTFPQTVRGRIYLDRLTSAEEFVFPKDP